ncbi:hypothetical protein M0R45_019705 [Rubus argutus]|uniref:Retrotransposon gag domain-containing protein n=1 Tax=Rubus argutus TaxID=59490 RepID=A0AAW1X6X6_RUBAR
MAPGSNDSDDSTSADKVAESLIKAFEERNSPVRKKSLDAYAKEINGTVRELAKNCGCNEYSEEKKKVTYGGTNKEGLHLFSDEQITALVRKAVRSHLCEEFGYNFPFSKEIAEVNYPKGHKTINFTLFSGENVKENAAVHIARFTTQCGDLGKSNLYKLKIFGSSLTGAAFGWYSRLKPASVSGWDEMEKIFHEQFGKIEA